MMVKVWLYAFMLGLHSSRKLERALQEDIGFRVLAANQKPDFWTLSEFRRRHHEAMGRLFDQTVHAAAEAGLVKLNHVSVDGTKVKANASKHRAMSDGYMKTEEDRLRKEIERWFEEAEATDRTEDELYGKGNSGWRLPPELATSEKRREFIQKFRKKLEERKATEAEESQPKSPPAKPRPAKPAPPENQIQLPFPDQDGSVSPAEDEASQQPSPKTKIRSTSPTRSHGS
jgi:hypothetical protein